LSDFGFFWFLGCYAATPLPLQFFDLLFLFEQKIDATFVLVFVYYNRHTASPPITSETPNTNGALQSGSPETPDQIEWHSRKGTWTRNRSCS